MSAVLHPCMGGHCAHRESCAHYHAGTHDERAHAAERLCERGRDVPTWVRPSRVEPMVLASRLEVKPSQTRGAP